MIVKILCAAGTEPQMLYYRNKDLRSLLVCSEWWAIQFRWFLCLCLISKAAAKGEEIYAVALQDDDQHTFEQVKEILIQVIMIAWLI